MGRQAVKLRLKLFVILFAVTLAATAAADVLFQDRAPAALFLLMWIAESSALLAGYFLGRSRWR